MTCPASKPQSRWESLSRRLQCQAALTVALLALAFTVSGCGSDESASSNPSSEVVEYVGGVAGSDINRPALEASAGDFFIAVAGSEVEVYTCDSAATDFRFFGEVNAGKLELRSESGQATLTASVTGTAVEGTLTIDGNPQTFRAILASGGSTRSRSTAEPSAACPGAATTFVSRLKTSQKPPTTEHRSPIRGRSPPPTV